MSEVHQVLFGSDEVRCYWVGDERPYRRVGEIHGIGVSAGDSWVPPAGHLEGKCQGVDFPGWIDPLFSNRAREKMEDLLSPFGEWLPLPLDGYSVYNCTTIKDWIDLDRSEVERFPSGGIMSIDRFEFLEDVVDDGVNAFQIEGYVDSRLFVSPAVVARLQSSGLSGASSRLVWTSTSGGVDLEWPW